MLRVGLTGGLGSGKSTVAAMLAERGAQVLQADEIGRALMSPGQAVYAAILAQFGTDVLRPDQSLDRAKLARLAFTEGRVEELNAIVHPAVIARQSDLVDSILARDPKAIAVVESALIFETRHGDGWRERFDALVLVTADDRIKVERYVARSAGARPTNELQAEARARLALQMPDAEKAPFCDYIVGNNESIEHLQKAVASLWESLQKRAAAKADHEPAP